ncbi:D-alanine--poly(phosphoribitol) ligase [Myxococcus llanfairpwllgwyngyllgogerychwyrndrobwllllantysiliogogogochensis]|uniref:D-alanine--poly(Phosphoribitol) ligase n=1 Tax=Myxococcus llanfairpwllgwyngyllgogerychwyrndrobwllllantysiliogogogochensis TaxID=2590453 RepID=A0A540X3Z4_9BACT|nr:amino acid adenylation domain-containing protein [Myxococcus llanfairpwllgwyngyllgogerychwyrndrobwllllantysiliogogogochensis]TQF15978.1 D-alanine--poly(phosphoribitol) ligase [Myxococcus llanfairpwllgwyngyllgogerychwyrndrobwllllantysiliogogogochensis]
MLFQYLEDSARAHSARIAVIDGERTYSYEELEAASNQMARTLRNQGIGRGDRVGLHLDKSLEAIIGLFGILKAGAAYVPIDPASPEWRLNFIARDCALSGVITIPTWHASLRDVESLRCIILVEARPTNTLRVPQEQGAPVTLTWADVRAQSSAPVEPLAESSPEDLAYILYTSGSTGQPKGVMLSHRAGHAFVDWAFSVAGVRPGDRVSSHAPLHFDLSVFDVFATAKGAATLVLVPTSLSVFPRELADFIAYKHIAIWYSVPSVLTQLVARGELSRHGFPNLRTVLFAGEVFPLKYLRQLVLTLPRPRYLNLYGPTETNVCTFHLVTPADLARSEPLPIGQVCCGDEVFVIRDDGILAGAGEEGELCVAGPTLMSGYWGMEERTRQVLGPIPGHAFAYRTGDRVIRESGGALCFLGRRDDMVKVRGHRIELSAVEEVLLRHPDVEESAALTLPDDLTGNELRAFVVLRDNASTSPQDLRQHCANYLPRYMVPTRIDACEALPKTTTGKKDKVRLQEQARQLV